MAQAGFKRRDECSGDAEISGVMCERTGTSSDEPTLLKLKTMKGADGNPLRIIPRIAAGDYMTFGMCLLQDENGVDVDLLKKTHASDGPVGITDAIIKKWLTSGATPTRTCTYQHLIECLRQSELGALAEEIANTTAGEGVTKDISSTTFASGETNQTTTCLTATQESQHTKGSQQSCELSTNAQKEETTTITRPDPQITSYASYLKGVYIHLSQSYTSQHWTHLPRCEFVQLAMIRGKELQRGGPEEEMVRLAQQGKIETIMSDKIPTDLESLFLLPPLVVPPKFHNVILIEGPPGGGKSTLALHICHKWAQGASFLAQFDIVVLAYLRDKAIQNASTLAGILPADIKKVSQMVATQMRACYGKNVLFIFDGWDEFPTKLQNKSLISTIIKEPHKLSLYQCTVVITTRPVASGNLLHIADQRVEILGFTRHQVCEYIEKALDGDSGHIQKLFQHLKDHPVILEGYCYIPLHVATLVHIFLTMKGILPTTLHELFYNLVLCCIVRELETHESGQTLDAELSSLDDLSDDLKSQLSDLSLLAYKGVMQDKVIFYKKDLKAFHLSTNLPSLGLLQAVERLTLTSKSCSYNFLHLSVQELLAAYHISQMKPSTQVEVFKKLFGSPRFEAVLHYYCGFTKLENPAIQDFISTYSRQQTYFKHILSLLHCFFEAQQPHLAQLIDHKFTDVIDLEFLSDNPADYLVVGYFISSLLSSSTSDEPNSIQLKMGDNVNDYRLELLLSQLSMCSIKRQLQMNMYKSRITGKVIASHLKQSPSAINELSIVHVGNIQRYEDGLLHIVEALQSNCSLAKLKLNYVYLNCSRENGSVLTKMLCMNKTLTHLDLSYTRLSDMGAHCIFQGLQQNTTLIHLNLRSNEITGCEDTAQALNKLLQVNKTLTHLNLSENKIFSYSSFRCILEGIQRNTTLVHLNLAYTGLSATEDTTRALTTMLQVNTSLTHLILSHNYSFYSSGACSIFKTLQHNTTLVHLDLSQTGIGMKKIGVDGQSTFQALHEMLNMNKTLAYLNLSNNAISFPESAACSIFQALQHNTALVHLDLYGSIFISDEVAVCIAEALESNCSLQVLDIFSNQIGKIGFVRIAKSLESNTTLRELYLVYDYYEPTVNDKVHAIHKIRQEKGLHSVHIGI